MPKKTYIYKELEFNIIKRDYVVKITCIDNKTNKLYEQCFTNCDINNFYDTICYSFENNTIVDNVLSDTISFSEPIFDMTVINVLNEKIRLLIITTISLHTIEYNILLLCVNNNIVKCVKRIKELENNMMVVVCYFGDYPYYVHKYINVLELHCENDFDIRTFYCHNKLITCYYDSSNRKLTIHIDTYIDNLSNITFSKYLKTIKTKSIIFVHGSKQLTAEELSYFPQLI